MVDGPGRGRSSLGWFLAGALMGGGTSGAAIGIGALLIPATPLWMASGLIGFTALLVVLNDSGTLVVPFPQNHRQVRQTVIDMQPAAGAPMFGFEMGTGARTHVTGSAPYIVVVAALLADGYGLAGLLAGLGFGLGRGLVPLDRRMHHHEEAWGRWILHHGKLALPLVSAATTTAVAVATVFR